MTSWNGTRLGESRQRDRLQAQGLTTVYSVIAEIEAHALRQFQSSHSLPTTVSSWYSDGTGAEYGLRVLPEGEE